MFVVYALPRSRSFWLSRFLTYGDWQCSHDEALHMRGLDDVRSWLRLPCHGSVETAAAPYWRLIQNYCPDITTIVLRRPTNEIIDSMRRTGVPFEPDRFQKTMDRLNCKLDQIERRVPNVLSISYADLQSEDTCKAVFERCLPYAHDHQWWQDMACLNLQSNIRQTARYFLSHQAQLTKLAKTCKHRSLVDITHNWRAKDFDDGITFAEESAHQAYADAAKCMSDHLVQVGEDPDAVLKNVALMNQMDKMGAMQIVTARCNGRMFGYMLSFISPSVESPDKMTALNASCYASPEFPGLGMRLQREAIRRFREKGIHEVNFYAGVRGTGQRIATLFKRLGASENGRLYNLKL